MYYTKLFDKTTKKRQRVLESYLDVFFPNTIANLISNYDCYLDGKAYTFDCFPNPPLRTFDDDDGYYRTIWCMTTLHDGRIAIGGNSVCKIINPQTNSSNTSCNCDNIFTDLNGSVSRIAELHDKRIVIGSSILTTYLQIWNPRTGKCDMILQNNDTYIKNITVLSDGRVMGSCLDINNKKLMFKIWNITTGCVDAIFSNRMSKCCTANSCIKLFPTGQMIVVTNHHTLALWNPFGSAEQPTGPLPPQRMLVSPSRPQTKDIHMISKDYHDMHIPKAILLTNGQIIVSQDKKVKIYTNTLYKKQKKINYKVIDNDNAYCIVELPDERIAYSTYEGRLKIVDMKNNKCDMVLQSEHNVTYGMTYQCAYFNKN
jgi:WD40 repeat protein